MMPRVLLLLFAASFVTPVNAQLLREKADRDEVILADQDIPEMANAIRRARDTLPAFFALADNPRRNTYNFAVKVDIPTRRGSEYLWFALLKREGPRLHGRLVNTPRWTTSFAIGQKFLFEERDVVDWLYIDGKQMKGNHTACAIRKMASVKEAEALFKRDRLICE